MTATAHRIPAALRAPGYDPDGQVDLPGFAGSLSAYTVVLASLVAAGRLRGRTMPDDYPVKDLVLGGIAVHKLSRILSKSSVTSPLRAPFTQFEEPAGAAEHVESPRSGHGPRHTIGELLTCPFCVGMWVGTGYLAALVHTPRVGRGFAALFTVTALSDALQLGYDALRRI